MTRERVAVLRESSCGWRAALVTGDRSHGKESVEPCFMEGGYVKVAVDSNK